MLKRKFEVVESYTQVTPMVALFGSVIIDVSIKETTGSRYHVKTWFAIKEKELEGVRRVADALCSELNADPGSAYKKLLALQLR